MKLSSKGRYAVMAMTDLARHESARPVPLADIAARQEISHSYLEQIFGRMRKAGLVVSARGPGGGYRLARDAHEIDVAEIVAAVNEPLEATRCTQGSRGCLSTGERCLTHDLWDALGEQIYVFLKGVSLDDVVARRVRRSTLQPLAEALAP